ncbi:MAG: SO_0444 family Cu/Zn efflux transporter [Bacteroidales bacterium]|nr:SO_0444 family Cu/Zn efflux transporter [Bacteroidales bacterium]
MQYLSQLLALVAEMIPYLLLGFLFAGLLHVLVPHKFYQKYLSQNNFRSVILASLFGIPLPLCSCGVIPTAMSLRKEGGSKAATTAFLCATPQTGVDSILATFSVFGLAFAIIRPAAALVSALLIGGIICIVEKEPKTENASMKSGKTGKNAQESIWQKTIRALRYGFVEMIQDIGGHMLTGLLIAGLISVALPESWLLSLSDRPLLEMMAVMLFAVPMYVCATGSIPIAAALMLKGLTPGAALVFLMAGPAINFASILVINKALGKKVTGIFVACIILCALLFGLSIDYLMPASWFNAISAAGSCSHETVSVFQWICLGLFSLLLINAFALRKCSHKHAQTCSCGQESNCENSDSEQHCSCSDACKDEIESESAMPAQTKARVYHVEGMHCNHCRRNLEEALNKLPGVDQAEVSLEEKTATVVGSHADEDVINCIKSLGFEHREN